MLLLYEWPPGKISLSVLETYVKRKVAEVSWKTTNVSILNLADQYILSPELNAVFH